MIRIVANTIIQKVIRIHTMIYMEVEEMQHDMDRLKSLKQVEDSHGKTIL